jgi:primosomal protein N' (replication factor Y)
MADSAAPAVQALVRWDRSDSPSGSLPIAPNWIPAGDAGGRPVGTSVGIAELLSIAQLPAGAVVLGPVPAAQAAAAAEQAGTPGTPDEADQARALVRVPRAGTALATALRVAAGVRSAQGTDAVRIQIDPHHLD